MRTGTETSESIYLLAGEHDLQLLLANGNRNAVSSAQDTDSGMVMDWWYRDPYGDFHAMDSSFFYTAAPEPASLLLLGSIALLKRHKRKVV